MVNGIEMDVAYQLRLILIRIDLLPLKVADEKISHSFLLLVEGLGV